MSGLNKVFLIGNVGKDPEIRTLQGDVKVATFSLATSENYKNKDCEWAEKTEWHNIVAWRNAAETVERTVQKGTKLHIEGKITQRSWEDKDKNKKYITEIIVERIMPLANMIKKEEKAASTESSHNEPPPPAPDDVLPF